MNAPNLVLGPLLLIYTSFLSNITPFIGFKYHPYGNDSLTVSLAQNSLLNSKLIDPTTYSNYLCLNLTYSNLNFWNPLPCTHPKTILLELFFIWWQAPVIQAKSLSWWLLSYLTPFFHIHINQTRNSVGVPFKIYLESNHYSQSSSLLPCLSEPHAFLL